MVAFYSPLSWQCRNNTRNLDFVDRLYSRRGSKMAHFIYLLFSFFLYVTGKIMPHIIMNASSYIYFERVIFEVLECSLNILYEPIMHKSYIKRMVL